MWVDYIDYIGSIWLILFMPFGNKRLIERKNEQFLFPFRACAPA